ncbi:IpaC/SipC family type III secretion system effector [Escherichia coli]|uniref:IpaC/SipC family type III secretion system effector n=1 Tax=Escherichia TaxID=561 RepID=UPI0020BD6F52|nr:MULTISPECIES: IpaC/SipC family type III secretion system effector [Escherichia]MED0413980.1 IpaC/SipC family type III secretion system effector [Escherichia marmotae]EIM2897089.1 type III secretion system translocon subunit SctB [Escherichia coli]EIQ2079932.1 type III secretion system translocon subunit SctB [Escherichia coli]MBB9855444.1 type III secretion system translocon subunit SctB [Escherichia coli]MDY9722728.1 IpaC/SipC family type III secretion system effector [Escherichia coli]
MLTVNSGMNPSVNTSQVLVQPLTQPGLWFASVNEILSAPGMTEEGRGASASDPVLVPPAGDLSVRKMRDAASFLKNAGEDTVLLSSVEKEFIKKANEEIQRCMEEKQAGKEDFFDISNLSSGAIALLVAASMLMLSLNQADTRLAGKLSLVSFDAAKNMADSMKREGIGMLAGNISQSVLQLGLTGVGAKFGLKGLKNEKLALRQNTAKMTLTNDVKGTGQNIKDNLAFNARRQEMTGNAIMQNSTAVGNIAGGSGQYAATLERSEQQISQASNRVAGTASDDVRESARKANSLIQEILKIMESISQSKMTSMAAVAGNIRA